MCDYQHEYSFTFIFDESTVDNEFDYGTYDNGFESMWQQIGEELRKEQESDEFDQMFQDKLKLQSSSPPTDS